MPYSITYSDGTPLVTIADNTIDTTTTSLSLVGKNSLNFGQAIDQNLVNILQNWANSEAPLSPLPGQLWYNISSRSLYIWDSATWKQLVSPFDGTSGVATALLGINNKSVSITISENRIISIASAVAIQPSELPAYVVINDNRYYLSGSFPLGLVAGINLAAGMLMNGRASTAKQLAAPRLITLEGAINGTATWDASSNVTIETKFSNVYVNNSSKTVAGIYTKVYVSDGGFITGGGNILNSDIANALGYIPYDGGNVTPQNVPNMVVTRDSNGNFAANIMVGTATSAMALANPVMIGLNGDVLGAASFDASGDITITTQLADISGLQAGTYNTVTVDAKGRVIGAANIDAPPLGSMMLWTDPSYIPTGWALCNGQTITTPAGTFTTLNLTNITMGTAFYIMKVQ